MFASVMLCYVVLCIEIYIANVYLAQRIQQSILKVPILNFQPNTLLLKKKHNKKQTSMSQDL